MQTWKTKEIPDKWKKSQEEIFKLMPDYKYYLLTDKDNESFVKENFPQYLPLWNSLKYPIEKADVIRYMFLYKFGGYYLDLDIETTRRFDELPEGDLLFLPSANGLNCLTNSFLASEVGHPFWLELLDNLNKHIPFWALNKHLYVMYSTGPKIFDFTIKTLYILMLPFLLGSWVLLAFVITIRTQIHFFVLLKVEAGYQMII